MIPDWAIALLAVGLVIPAVLASFDAFARARRRRMPVGRGVGWTLAGSVPFGSRWLLAFVFQLIGWLPDSVSEALAPATSPSFGEALRPCSASLVSSLSAGSSCARCSPGRMRGIGLAAPAAAVALALVLSIEVLLVVRGRIPFTALMLVPAAHLCVLAALPERPRRSVLAGGILVGGTRAPVLALGYYGVAARPRRRPDRLRAADRRLGHWVGLDRGARLAAGGHAGVGGDRVPRAGPPRGGRRSRHGARPGHLRRAGVARRDRVGAQALSRPDSLSRGSHPCGGSDGRSRKREQLTLRCFVIVFPPRNA